MPAKTSQEEHEKRKAIIHWLKSLKEKLQPILTEYFDTKVCYDTDEIDGEYNITPIANIGYFQLVSSSNKSSNSTMENYLSSIIASSDLSSISSFSFSHPNLSNRMFLKSSVNKLYSEKMKICLSSFIKSSDNASSVYISAYSFIKTV